MHAMSEQGAPRPRDLPVAQAMPIVLSTVAVGACALWALQWLLAVALLSDSSFLPHSAGARTIGPSADEVLLSIVHHVGPLVIGGTLLLLTQRCVRRRHGSTSWLLAVLALCVPAAVVLL